jgi:F-type H+-transporting ATPase subunit b
MSRVRQLTLSAALSLLLFSATSARAAEESAAPSTGAFSEIFKWINFAIVAGLVVWVFWKKLPPVFRQNAHSIGSAIEKAAAAKQEADRQLAEAESKLRNLEKEVAALREEAEREAAVERERIRAATETDEQKIAVAAKGEIEAAELAARKELQELAARLAVDGAESLLLTRLTPAMQDSLINNFVKTLEGRPN